MKNLEIVLDLQPFQTEPQVLDTLLPEGTESTQMASPSPIRKMCAGPSSKSLRQKQLADHNVPAEFVCSKQSAQQLLTRLVQGVEGREGEADPIYLFSAEKRSVRITVLPSRKL